MKEFNCAPGECSKCCTDLEIPVTLGDLHRATVYAREHGVEKTLYQVFDERCSGWLLVPDRKLSYPLVVPKSRRPCYNLDVAEKVCNVHDSAQYVACRQCPEENLLSLSADATDFNKLQPERANIFASYECLRGVELTCDRVSILWKFIKLASDEMYITGMTLNNPAQPAVKSYSTSGLKQADAELRNRIRWLSTPQFMAQAWVNIGQTQGRYMELFGVAEPDYTRPPFFQTRRIGNAETLVPSSTHGQPNRAERRRLERKNHNFQ